VNVPRGTTGCRLERLAAARACEFVGFRGIPAELDPAVWPVAPGDVRRAADGAPLLLHFAPGRWLAPDPGADRGRLIDAAEGRGLGTRIDVDGKWVAMRLTGADATPVLASTIDIRAVLADRGCAALHLFDCPAIVMAAEGGYRLWVVASCAEAFEAAVGRLVR
jgi:sarcosine oxidase gamma subunit